MNLFTIFNFFRCTCIYSYSMHLIQDGRCIEFNVDENEAVRD